MPTFRFPNVGAPKMSHGQERGEENNNRNGISRMHRMTNNNDDNNSPHYCLGVC